MAQDSLFQVSNSIHLFGENAQQCHAAKRDFSRDRASSTTRLEASVCLDRDQIEAGAASLVGELSLTGQAPKRPQWAGASGQSAIAVVGA
ncbi:hypothetical protein XH92_35625 [Bradyrhizobium sp. CCBAU 53421]|nr:hypothetical protein XH92_35625 [Bradyrhizobium sp. CCBAU 53421]